jgi:prephenate dehydrogenase
LKVVIIGTGFMGTSIAAGLKRRGQASAIQGIDSAPTSLRDAEASGAYDALTSKLDDIEREADFVILCAPVKEIASLIPAVAAQTSAHSIITDIGSVKAPIALAAERSKDAARIVPAHPIAGSHLSGPLHARADLLNGKKVVLCPSGASERSNVDRTRSFYQSLGAVVEEMRPEVHDEVLAFTSHAPHLMAFATMIAGARLNGDLAQSVWDYVGGGYRDFTRVAAASPAMWSDILFENAANVRRAVRLIAEVLREFDDKIEAGDSEGVSSMIEQARTARVALDAPGKDRN